MTLEEQLLAAANAGLTHLSLHPVFSEDRKKTYWRATATPSTMHKYVSTQALNPVEAVAEVLKALPKAPKRAAKEVIAAVTQPMDLDRPTEQPPTEGLEAWLPKA